MTLRTLNKIVFKITAPIKIECFNTKKKYCVVSILKWFYKWIKTCNQTQNILPDNSIEPPCIFRVLMSFNKCLIFKLPTQLWYAKRHFRKSVLKLHQLSTLCVFCLCILALYKLRCKMVRIICPVLYINHILQTHAQINSQAIPMAFISQRNSLINVGLCIFIFYLCKRRRRHILSRQNVRELQKAQIRQLYSVLQFCVYCRWNSRS